MRDQDKRAVEGMARCGISLEVLIDSFSNFPAEEIEEIYNEINSVSEIDKEPIIISCNCS